MIETQRDIYKWNKLAVHRSPKALGIATLTYN
jgi:hypothetical protein